MRFAPSSLSRFVSAVMSIEFRQSEKNVQRLTTVNVTRRMKGKHFVPKASSCATRQNPRDGRNSESLDMATFKATDTITVIEGYDAIGVFLEAVWRRHGWPVEQIVFLLGSLKWADGTPVDPTSWQDWQAAVQMAVSAGSCETAAGK
jgi:hypothetical protein